MENFGVQSVLLWVFHLEGEEPKKRRCFLQEIVTNQDMFWTRVPVFVLPLNQELWNVSSLM